VIANAYALTPSYKNKQVETTQTSHKSSAINLLGERTPRSSKFGLWDANAFVTEYGMISDQHRHFLNHHILVIIFYYYQLLSIVV